MPRTVPSQSSRALRLLAVKLAILATAARFGTAAETTTPPAPVITLRDAVDEALKNNRQLQIERINQDIAFYTLRSSYGVYDPRFDARVNREESADTGGFDPANFSADATFTAESEIANAGLLGYLPSGLTYTIGGNYAHSYGERNFLNFDSHKISTGIYAEQPLLRNFWIDQPRYIIQVNKKNLKISELGVQFEAQNVINLTQQGYYDLQFAWENLRIQQDLIATRQHFINGVNRQVDLGYLTALDQRIVQSQTSTLQADFITTSNLVALASNNLRTLLGVSATNWTGEFIAPDGYLLTVPERLDLAASWETGMDLRPDLAQLAVNLERSDLGVKYRKNQMFPSLNMFGSYGLRGADAIQAFPPDDPRADRSLAIEQIKNRDAANSTIGLLFSIPLTSTAERNNYKVSKETKKQAELLLRQKEELIMREISDAINLAKFSFDRALAAREAVKYSEDALRAEEQRFTGGSGGITFVMAAQTELARTRLSEATARRDYNKALSQLYFTEGSLLERQQIELRFKE